MGKSRGVVWLPVSPCPGPERILGTARGAEWMWRADREGDSHSGAHCAEVLLFAVKESGGLPERSESTWKRGRGRARGTAGTEGP